MALSPFLSTGQTFNEAYQLTSERLQEAGLRFVRTFDLHTVRAGIHGCSCPNHGTEECDCQLVVLLVYKVGEQPVTLILHGEGGSTWFSTAESPSSGNNSALSAEIKRILERELACYSNGR
ncbi:MAG TPA: hypothetical protein VHO49_05915 [Anaerolineales bacterium]|nr:hypothetical protein [Anaerolineales bacterium]